MVISCSPSISETAREPLFLAASGGAADGLTGDTVPPRGSAQFDRGRQRVLIADADRPLASQIKARVEELGYRGIVASTGHEAIELACTQAPAVAVIDLELPDLYGGTVAQALRMMNPSLPIILLAGLAVSVAAEDAWRVQAFAYITKPFDLDALIGLVERALTRQSR